ncbi:glutamine amidotransferase [Mesotoga sp. Brook.08.YT.4.2.5.1]|uniref:type 1 glutamine amidotransferase n=1 Tax=unclassified Mesotoga TaxID=1184398 RepID=UPI000C185228|nr:MULTISPECIES: glutamine amidotransferase [unclassified Mesotoga]PNE22465.1 glutamine amidotransferase [Mesotoga sp. Brook.08.YT.4.2.5.1]PVD15622.1 hypothetical protein V512_001495 [Mesotoga sp. Brook.08.105.5.1]RAO98176.1 hypothetical protein M388_07515 [Mesotoga sp. Brook.08.YT.4.2.5.4.]RDI93131.1 glutamine amidotransferase [Mesotoga sp. Brook.08.YT.4.2.5.2.]
MICILVNDTDFGTSVSPVESALETAGVAYRTWRIFLEGFPEDGSGCDGLVLSGGFSMSEYFDGGSLSWGASFVKDFHGPVLGICLGMQILARLFQESLVASRELGVSKVRLDTSNELFMGMKSEVNAYQRHNYGLPYIPGGYYQIAWGESTFIQGIASLDGSRFGVQFHPEEIELGSEEELLRIFSNFSTIVNSR